MKNKLQKFGSGATSSENKPDYSCISSRFLKRTAARFALGGVKHGRGNYVRGIEKEDIKFLRDRYNHAVEHLFALKDKPNGDDHIGAVAWFLSFATDVEDAGFDWHEILKVVTPEDDPAENN